MCRPLARKARQVAGMVIVVEIDCTSTTGDCYSRRINDNYGGQSPDHECPRPVE